MVVQHNLTAMNSNRMLGVTTSAQAKSTEKLSSGYKINRAADDAAGLSISEKMRKQIRGLTQASLNAEDGISSVQTAEGALNEVQDMLQRMNELAVKAANGTMSENDRSYIQDEVDQLVTEIDRVAETTKFNETYLLKGDRTAEKGYTFEYATETAYTFEAKESSAAVALKGTAIYGADGKEITEDDLDGMDSLDDLTYTDYYTGIQGKDSSKTTGATGTGTDVTATLGSIVTFNATSGAVSYADEETAVLYNADGSKITDLSAVFTAKESTPGSGTYDQLWLNADAVVYTAIEGKTQLANADALATYFEVDDAAAYTFKDGTSSAAVTDLSAYVEVEEGALKYKEGMSLKDADGNPINEADLGDYISFEEGETETISYYDADGNKIAKNALSNYIDVDEEGAMSLKEGVELYVDEDATTAVTDEDLAEDVTNTQNLVGALTLKLHVGADATLNNQISIDIAAMSAHGLGVADEAGNMIKVDGKDDKNALAAIDTIKEAIQKVSTQRSALGAVQNRLEHTIANLDNVVENTTAAESQIRDTDMATEMVKYSNNQILAQAGQSMLAQANQSNQGVLSLLG